MALTQIQRQTAVIQTERHEKSSNTLPLSISHNVPMPDLSALPTHHALIRILAVALNPTDHKMPIYLPMPGTTTGCDFCGVIVTAVEEHEDSFPTGTRVCGSTFAYNASRPLDGAFAQFAVADVRLMLRVPAHWTDLEGAALGGVGWRTASLALWDPAKLALPGRPSQPASSVDEPEPVLVYGAATATGTMACQLLKLSGYRPIAITSPASASLARQYGAFATISYISPSAATDAQMAAGGAHKIRAALDCITSAESTALYSAAIARRGGRYACLEAPQDGWVTRKAVRTAVVMGYETTGTDHDFGAASPYTRLADPERLALGIECAVEVQRCLDAGGLVCHAVREIKGGWGGIIKGLEILRSGKVSGEKLVVRIPQE